VTVRLESARLVLLQLAPDSAARAVAFHRDNMDHLAPWDPPRPVDFLTESYWRAALARQLDEAAAGRALRLWMVAREDEAGAVLGTVSFTAIERGPLQGCRLGYAIDHRHQGQGLMAEALRSAIAHAFGPLKLHRIEAGHLPENHRSARLLRRLGFVPFGYSRDYLYIAGAWRDHVHNALTNPEPMTP